MDFYCSIVQEGQWFSVSFPDVPNAITMGSTLEEAKAMAADVLNGVIATDIAQGQALPSNATGPASGLFPCELDPTILIASELRSLRGKTSQSEIAARLGMTYQTYQHLENPQKSNPTLKTLNKVAKAYGKRLEVHLS